MPQTTASTAIAYNIGTDTLFTVLEDEAMEQSSALYPGSQLQRPYVQIPFPEQPFGHGNWVEQLVPDHPGEQKQRP